MRLAAALAAVIRAGFIGSAGAKAVTPHFKWGQTKDAILLSVMVRDLDKGTVEVSLPDGDLQFRAKSLSGDEYALDLPLREDVEATFKYEQAARPDKWGVATVITLTKVHQHRWDLLVQNPKKFKGLIDKDWSREDQSLEPEDEIPFVEDNDLLTVTEKTLNKTLAKFSPLVVNVRYPWCTTCTNADATFAKAAKTAKKSKDMKKVGFAVLDAREERRFAKSLGAVCDMECDYKIFPEAGEGPLRFSSSYNESELLQSARKYIGPAVQVVKSEAEVAALIENGITCVGGFASEADPKYRVFKTVANTMRGELVFAARFGAEKAVELTPQKETFTYTYDGMLEDNGTALRRWILPRALPLVQQYDWPLRKTYEKIGLPIAKVWLNDTASNPTLDQAVRDIVRRVAKNFVGRLAFIEVKKSTYSYELRDFGLNHPEAYPAFGIASNTTHDSLKWALEITEDVPVSSPEFWSDAERAVEKLGAFCESVLAGEWPQAHESGTPQTNWTEGTPKAMTYRGFAEIRSPERPLLLEVFGKFRDDEETRKANVKNLAAALKPEAGLLTLAQYDTTDNYLPPEEFERDKYLTSSEWYWVPAKAAGAAERAPATKLETRDPPTRTLVEFAAKQLGASLDVEAVMARFEEETKANPPPPPPPPRPTQTSMGDLEGMDPADLQPEAGKFGEMVRRIMDGDGGEL